jgi:hypothetical protein
VARTRKIGWQHEKVRGRTSLRAAARKIVEIANDVEAVQNGRIYIERVNAPFLAVGGPGDDFRAGIERATCSAGYGCTRAGRV